MHESMYSVHAGPGKPWWIVLCYSYLALSTSVLDPVILQEPKHSGEALRQETWTTTESSLYTATALLSGVLSEHWQLLLNYEWPPDIFVDGCPHATFVSSIVIVCQLNFCIWELNSRCFFS